jgi:hypothetical protein
VHNNYTTFQELAVFNNYTECLKRWFDSCVHATDCPPSEAHCVFIFEVSGNCQPPRDSFNTVLMQTCRPLGFLRGVGKLTKRHLLVRNQ